MTLGGDFTPLDTCRMAPSQRINGAHLKMYLSTTIANVSVMMIIVNLSTNIANIS